jgi:hypothetical protein
MINDLEAIRARANAATPGPWKVNKRGHIGGGDFGTDPVVINESGIEPFFELGAEGPDNSTFIAHSRQDVPALCDEIESLRSRVALLEKSMEGMEFAQVGTREKLLRLQEYLGYRGLISPKIVNEILSNYPHPLQPEFAPVGTREATFNGEAFYLRKEAKGIRLFESEDSTSCIGTDERDNILFLIEAECAQNMGFLTLPNRIWPQKITPRSTQPDEANG